MQPRSRTILRVLLGFAAVSLVVIGRGAFVHGPWMAEVLRLFGPVSGIVGYAVAGMTHPNNASPFFAAAAGCVLLGCLLPKPGEVSGPWPEIQPAAVRRRDRQVVAALLSAAAALAGVAAYLLREQHPGNGSVVLWLAGIVLAGAAVAMLDRWRGTSIGNPLPARRDAIAVLLLFAGDLLLIGHDVGHWRWVGTPDEANFYPFALDIAQWKSPHFILSETGMYGVHPLLSSYYQAAFMWVFGEGIVGWRLSSAFALAGSLPFVYLLGRELHSRRFGVSSAVLFGTTPLAVGFAHFGYNNAQIYLFVTGSLAALVWAMRRRSVLGYWLAGTIAGLAVFTFYPARVAPVLLLMLAAAVREVPWRRRRAEWAVLVLAALLAATPCLVHPVDTLDRMFGQTAFQPPAAAPEAAPSLLDRVAGKGARLARHWTLSMLFPLWYPSPSHFQTNTVVDPLQGALAVTGLVLAWRAVRRQRASRFLAPAYCFSALAVGAVSQHDTPPLTRLLFLCPFLSMLAALALEQVCVPLATAWRRPRLATASIAALVAVSALWGTAVLRDSVYVRWHGYGEGTTTELARVLWRLPPHWKVVYVQRVPTYMSGVDAVLAEYGLSQRLTYLRDSPEIMVHLPEAKAVDFLLVHDIPVGPRREEFEQAMSGRFPGRAWRDEAPGQRWNLRVLPVARIGDGGWQPPPLPDRGEIGQILFGFLDW